MSGLTPAQADELAALVAKLDTAGRLHAQAMAAYRPSEAATVKALDEAYRDKCTARDALTVWIGEHTDYSAVSSR